MTLNWQLKNVRKNKNPQTAYQVNELAVKNLSFTKSPFFRLKQIINYYLTNIYYLMSFWHCICLNVLSLCIPAITGRKKSDWCIKVLLNLCLMPHPLSPYLTRMRLVRDGFANRFAKPSRTVTKCSHCIAKSLHASRTRREWFAKVLNM